MESNLCPTCGKGGYQKVHKDHMCSENCRKISEAKRYVLQVFHKGKWKNTNLNFRSMGNVKPKIQKLNQEDYVYFIGKLSFFGRWYLLRRKK